MLSAFPSQQLSDKYLPLGWLCWLQHPAVGLSRFSTTLYPPEALLSRPVVWDRGTGLQIHRKSCDPTKRVWQSLGRKYTPGDESARVLLLFPEVRPRPCSSRAVTPLLQPCWGIPWGRMGKSEGAATQSEGRSIFRRGLCTEGLILFP